MFKWVWFCNTRPKSFEPILNVRLKSSGSGCNIGPIRLDSGRQTQLSWVWMHDPSVLAQAVLQDSRDLGQVHLSSPKFLGSGRGCQTQVVNNNNNNNN